MDSFKMVTNSKETPNGSMQPMTAAIDPSLKLAAEQVFESLGLTPSEAIRLFYKQVELHQGLPFEVTLPKTTPPSKSLAQSSSALQSEETEASDGEDSDSYRNIDQFLDSLSLGQ